MKVFWGENKCMHEQCKNKAYYSLGVGVFGNVRYMCGVHTRRFKKRRKQLPKCPNAAQKRAKKLKQRELLVNTYARRKREKGEEGDLICTKMRMMRAVDHHDGFLKVFPNRRHGSRKDGMGAPELSPMCLGPVRHSQPSVPESVSIENYHQFNKVFSQEVDDNGDPLPGFFERQHKGYLDRVPHRHKFSKAEMKHLKNRNIPLYSMYQADDGEWRRFTYVQSRLFYCKMYEKLAKRTERFKKLHNLLKEGVSLQIVGYDGYEVTKTLFQHYEDASRPFGHEMVLYSLLKCDDPSKYPWNMYLEKHPDLYQGISLDKY